MYARELQINRNVVNQIEFVVLNQDQKPVNLIGKSIFIRILDITGSQLLLTKKLDGVLPLTGIMKLTLTSEESALLQPELSYYSLEIYDGDITDITTMNGSALFVDSQNDARGVIRISDSVYPRTIVATNITIPTHTPPVVGNAQPNSNILGPLTRRYHSSEIRNLDNQYLTIQYWLSEFCGNITIEGSDLADFTRSYTIANSVSYGNAAANPPEGVTTTVGTTIVGHYPFVRLAIDNHGSGPPVGNRQQLSGDVVKILAR